MVAKGGVSVAMALVFGGISGSGYAFLKEMESHAANLYRGFLQAQPLVYCLDGFCVFTLVRLGNALAQGPQLAADILNRGAEKAARVIK